MHTRRRPSSPPSLSEVGASSSPPSKRRRPSSPPSLSEVRASSPSSSSRPSKRVCIVCTSISEEFGDEYNIFIVDLISGGGSDSVHEFDFTAMSPTIRLDRDCVYEAAFCVLGSTLYVFEGYDSTYNPYGGKSVFSYELPTSNDVSNLKLDRTMLVEVSCLNHPKVSPKAAVTPDGKILVFSSVIETCPYNKCDFEIFDPDQRKCHKLPRLRPNPDEVRGLSAFWILKFSFIVEKSVLILRTELGIFTLNLKPPHTTKSWRSYGFRGAPSIPSHPGTSFVLIGKEICLIPFSAYDIDEDGIEKTENPFSRWYYIFPELSSLPASPGFSFESGGITLLEDDFNIHQPYCSFCLLKVGVNNDTMHAHMILDVYSLDLQECRGEIAKYRRQKMKEHKDFWKRKREGFLLPGATKVKSFKFFVKAQQFHGFNLCSFSFIRAASTISTSAHQVSLLEGPRRGQSG